jgi:hypothetical protein
MSDPVSRRTNASFQTISTEPKLESRADSVASHAPSPAPSATKNSVDNHPAPDGQGAAGQETKLSRFLEKRLEGTPSGHRTSLDLSAGFLAEYAGKASGKAEIRHTAEGKFEVTLEASVAAGIGAKDGKMLEGQASLMAGIKAGTKLEFESAAQCSQFLDALIVAGAQVTSGVAVRASIYVAQKAHLVADDASAQIGAMLLRHGTKISLGTSLEGEVSAQFDGPLKNGFGAKFNASASHEISIERKKQPGGGQTYTLSLSEAAAVGGELSPSMMGLKVGASGSVTGRTVLEATLTQAQFEGLRDGKFSVAQVLKSVEVGVFVETEYSGAVKGGMGGVGQSGEMTALERRNLRNPSDVTTDVTYRPWSYVDDVDVDAGPLELELGFQSGPEFSGTTLAEAQAKASAAAAQANQLQANQALARARQP